MNTVIEILHTRKAWDELGFAVPLRTKPDSTEIRDGKDVALFRQDQTRPKPQIGELCNWSFDLIGQPEDMLFVDQQLWEAAKHDRILRKLERERRLFCEAAMRRLFPEYAKLMIELDAAEKRVNDMIWDIRRANQKNRCRVDTAEDSADLKAAKKYRNELYKFRKEMVVPLYRDEQYREVVAVIEEEHTEAEDRERERAREAGLGWGTVGAVKKSLAKIRKGAPPKIHDFDGSGSLYVQIQDQKGKPQLTWERMLSRQDPRVTAVLNGKRLTVHVSFGGKGDNRQIVSGTITMHRKRPNGEYGFPVGTVVKGIRLCCRSIGYRRTFSLVFQLQRPGGFPKSWMPAESGRVAIDIGWRKLPYGVRVAYWVGDDGRHGEVVIPNSNDNRVGGTTFGLPQLPSDRPLTFADFSCNGTGKAVDYYLFQRSLQEIRDRNFDEMVAALLKWRNGHQLPEWWFEKPHELQFLALIKSKERLLKAWAVWRDNRFDGDEVGFKILSDWRWRKDGAGITHGELHLNSWESHARVKFDRWRKDYYRRFLALLRSQYTTVIFEKMNISKLRENPDPDEEGVYGDNYANMAAVGLLRQLAGDIEEVPANYTTVTCHRCKNICEWDQAKYLRHTCEHCGCEFDQDENAARNLLCGSNNGCAVP